MSDEIKKSMESKLSAFGLNWPVPMAESMGFINNVPSIEFGKQLSEFSTMAVNAQAHFGVISSAINLPELGTGFEQMDRLAARAQELASYFSNAFPPTTINEKFLEWATTGIEVQTCIAEQIASFDWPGYKEALANVEAMTNIGMTYASNLSQMISSVSTDIGFMEPFSSAIGSQLWTEKILNAIDHSLTTKSFLDLESKTNYFKFGVSFVENFEKRNFTIPSFNINPCQIESDPFRFEFYPANTSLNLENLPPVLDINEVDGTIQEAPSISVPVPKRKKQNRKNRKKSEISVKASGEGEIVEFSQTFEIDGKKIKAHTKYSTRLLMKLWEDPTQKHLN